MKICPECGRSYADDAVVCAYDGFALSTGSTSAWTGETSSAPGAGDVLGAYRILEQIAEGGMGVIYRAEHVRLGRQVALKVLKPELARRTDVVRRFFEEARAVNEIGHPNIVDIIDFVEVGDQDPPLVYMVMELLGGEDLAARLRSAGPLEPHEAVGIAVQVCEALMAVHRVKILHRDLKPENIFLVRGDDGGQKVKLLDFGVARSFGKRHKESLTDPGIAIGTPEYMAPEQVLGKELDERTDIYALGLVLYAMLTNSVPFEGRQYGELLVAQVKEAPAPLARRRGGGAPLPQELEQAVMRCLNKMPLKRFQNVGELEQALREAVGLTAPAASAGGSLISSPGLARPAQRRGGPWVPIGLGAGALLAGFATVWLLLGDEPQPATADVHGPEAGRVAAIEADSAAARRPDARAAGAAAVLPDAAADLGPVVANKPGQARRHRHLPKARAAVGSAREKKREKPAPKPKRRGIEATLDPFAK